MKKVFALLLTAAMLLTLLAGCGSEGGQPGDDPAPGEEDGADPADPDEPKAPADSQNDGNSQDEAPPKYKIGVILYSKEDSLGARMYSLLNDAAEALGIELVFALGDMDTPSQLTSAENLISAGCQGIWLLPLAETSSQKISALCEDNGVYLGICLRTFTDPDINEQVRGNPYFVGNILGDDYGNAKELTRILIEDFSCRELAACYAAEGSSLAYRNEGVRDAITEYGATQLAEATGIDANVSAVPGYIQNFVNTNPTLQGIVLVSGTLGMGETASNTLLTMDAEGVKYACFDAFDGMVDCFNDGYLQVVCGGQAPACLYVLSMIYNAIDGHPLTESGLELRMTYLFVKSAEEAEDFLNYVENDQVSLYTDEEIKNMTVRFNPDFSWDGLQQVMKDYTFENIISKVKG